MTKQDIIKKFELYFDDGTSLSSQEESDLFDKIYQNVCLDRPWEFLKKTGTGTQSTTLPYINLPNDFQYLTTNSSYSTSDFEAGTPVVFVGSDYTPYRVVSWSDRRQYRTANNTCYIDIVNNKLYFNVQPTVSNTVEFDYASFPSTSLALTESPSIPDRFQDIIYHGMVVDQNIIEMSDKAKSYASENQAMYNSTLKDMAYWNSNLIQM